MSNRNQELKDAASARIEVDHAKAREWDHMEKSHPSEWARKSEAFRDEYNRRWSIGRG